MGLAARQTVKFAKFEQIQLARSVIQQEADSIAHLAQNIPADFSQAADALANCVGSVIVTGIGKAGWIGQKISASLSSTGTRSHFLHPSEAVHGDLGRIGAEDIVLALSNSGETAEMIGIIPTIQRMNVPIFCITGKSKSTLAGECDLILDYTFHREACPLGLAPTTSTALMLAMGDALAMVSAKIRNLQPQDFARCHPGGSLGRKLSNVHEVMRPVAECRVAPEHQTVREVYIQLAGPARRTGAVLLVNHEGILTGIFTDSDLARLLEKQKDDLLDCPVGEVMTRNPQTISDQSKTVAAVEILASLNLSELPVIDDQRRPVGLIDITDVVGLFPVSA